MFQLKLWMVLCNIKQFFAFPKTKVQFLKLQPFPTSENYYDVLNLLIQEVCWYQEQ